MLSWVTFSHAGGLGEGFQLNMVDSVSLAD